MSLSNPPCVACQHFHTDPLQHATVTMPGMINIWVYLFLYCLCYIEAYCVTDRINEISLYGMISLYN